MDRVTYPPSQDILEPKEAPTGTYDLLATCKNCGFKHIAVFDRGTGPYEAKQSLPRVSKQHPSTEKPVCIDWPCPNCMVIGVMQFSPKSPDTGEVDKLYKQLQDSEKRRELFECRSNDLVKELNKVLEDNTALRAKLAENNIPLS